MVKKWTEETIVQALGRVFAISRGIDCAPNVLMYLHYYKDRERYRRDRENWGRGEYEADFVYISKLGYLHEIEVKISIADFRNDQKKRHFHDHPEVRGFSYCMPSKLYQAHLDEIKSVCEKKGAGLILVQDDGTIKTVIKAIPRLHVPKLPLQSLIFYLKIAAKKWVKNLLTFSFILYIIHT